MSTAPRRTYLDPELLNTLGPVEVEMAQLVEGFMAGVHRSPHRGHSVEFAQHRSYVPGDETRRVDWKVFARSDRLVIKEFYEETNFTAHLLIDASASMQYASSRQLKTKFVHGCYLAAALAYLIIRQHDAVSLRIFDERLAGQAAMGTHFQFLNTLSLALEQVRPTNAGNTGVALAQAAQHIDRRGMVLVISDLLDDIDAIARGVRLLRARGHEVTLLQIVDPAELTFPFEGNHRFDDLEGDDRLRLDARRLREAYLDELEQHQTALRRVCSRTGAELQVARTDRNLRETLLTLLVDRMRRLGAGR